jgi:septum formation protein
MIRPKSLVLASRSPRRQQLLEEMGLSFEIHPAEVEEMEHLGSFEPEDYTLENARRKGRKVSALRPEDLVLSADTTVLLADTVLNKPKDLEEAKSMLMQLSGKAHTVFTGVNLFWEEGGLSHSGAVASRVVFQPLSKERISAYFKIVDPLDKAGSYGIQEGKELIIDHFEGSFSNIMGLPVEWLEVELSRLNFLDLFRRKKV